MRLIGDLLEGVTADEIVIELHVEAVAEFVRRRVVVLDILGDEAAGDRAGRLVTLGRQPFPVALHLVAAIDGRER